MRGSDGGRTVCRDMLLQAAVDIVLEMVVLEVWVVLEMWRDAGW